MFGCLFLQVYLYLTLSYFTAAVSCLDVGTQPPREKIKQTLLVMRQNRKHQPSSPWHPNFKLYFIHYRHSSAPDIQLNPFMSVFHAFKFLWVSLRLFDGNNKLVCKVEHTKYLCGTYCTVYCAHYWLSYLSWFTLNLPHLKAKGGQLEHLFKKTGLTIHKEIYNDQIFF